MINIYDKNRKKVAVLQNAFEIKESMKLNAVSALSFSLPDGDDKAKYCQPLYYAQWGDGELYRIITTDAESGETGALAYQCEHAIATLVDKVLFGTHIVGNTGMRTAAVIRYALAGQSDWTLGECDFDFQYEYAWENENLLGALFSVPELFVEPYAWTYNTSVYPWRVSLKRIDEAGTPQFYLRAKKNILSSRQSSDAAQICTRLYLLGAGEGVNQVNVAAVNGGRPYVEDPEAVARYGLIERIFADPSFDEPLSLLERGRALLAAYTRPRMNRAFKAVDLYPLTNDSLDRAMIGGLVRLEDGTTTYITRISYNRDTPGDMELTLSTSPVDAAESIADLADRQRIESVYSQGATQLYAQSMQANATSGIGAKMNFYVPEDMKYINFVKAKIKMSAFRSYTSVTESNGGASQTLTGKSSSVTVQSQSATARVEGQSGEVQVSGNVGLTIPNLTVTTDKGTYTYPAEEDSDRFGSYTGPASVAGVSHRHEIFRHRHYLPALTARGGKASGSATLSGSFAVPGQTMDINIPGQSIDIPGQSVSLELPAHSHEIKAGIFTGSSSQNAGIYVNGAYKATVGTSGELDITEYLLGADGKIPRGGWQELEIRPNNMAYITIDLFVKGFVQSRGGNTY